jgi:hypothetical protein
MVHASYFSLAVNKLKDRASEAPELLRSASVLSSLSMNPSLGAPPVLDLLRDFHFPARTVQSLTAVHLSMYAWNTKLSGR